MTVNTDFAQVEADDQQINLDRFSLFFPEKRPFFLENSGLFRVGGRSSSRGSTELFFSRRIGLSGGVPVPILGGVRLSGRAGAYNVGFLNMQTDDLGDVHGNNFTVARLGREYRNRSRAGVLVVNRQGTGSLAPDNDYNRTFAVDGQVGIGQFTEVSGWVAQTETPGRPGDDHGLGLNGSYSSPFWRWRMGYAEIGENFNPEVGFLSRSGYRQLNGYVRRRFRPAGEGRVKEFGPRIYYDSFWNFDGYQETQALLRRRRGRVPERRAGQPLRRRPLRGPARTLHARRSRERTGRGVRRPRLLPVHEHEPRPGGEPLHQGPGRGLLRRQPARAGSLAERPARRLPDLGAELVLQTTSISPRAPSRPTSGRLRVTYAFSTRLLLQALIQYNDLTHSTSTNLRFSWLNEANRGLFVVYNEISEFGLLGLDTPDRSLAVKYNRTFDVFR